MDNKTLDDHGIEKDEFPDDFQCCVCLDLLYKPVVLACGHISCFWCVFNAMDHFQESHCPVCRHPYNHFPSICQLLHFVLLKLYPVAYKRRERQVLEEEKKEGFSSPQFNDQLSGSHASNELDIVGTSVNSSAGPHASNELDIVDTSVHSATGSQAKLYPDTCSTRKQIPSSLTDSSETNVPDKETTNAVMVSGCVETTGNQAMQYQRGACKQVSVADLLCAGCKDLLFRPVVLNCGHVYCESCINNPVDEIPRCQCCQSMHPYGFPKVCLVLKHFLEEQFSEIYAQREAVLKQADCQYGSSSCSTQAQQNGARSLSKPEDYSSLLSSNGPNFHAGVGCDFCGMSPIIGKRYKCKDCTEKIGFDLCEACYKTPSKLPGRFNQQHTEEHKFEIIEPGTMVHVLLWPGIEEAELGLSDGSEDHGDDTFPADIL